MSDHAAPPSSVARRLGVCSWSLRPESPADLIAKIAATGLRRVQLALDPLRTDPRWGDEAPSRLAEAGIAVVSGMMAMHGEDYSTLESIRRTGGVRPDDAWPFNLRAAHENAEVAAGLGIGLVTFHAGFVPHDREDPERRVLVDRLRQIIDAFGERGVRVGLETGQETAATLLSVLADLARPTVGVNFDPANMILYGMGDPVEAVERLGSRIAQAHIKDANPSAVPGAWGDEVCVGTGSVPWGEFLQALDRSAGPVDLMIEREAGECRAEDIRTAREHVERVTGDAH